MPQANGGVERAVGIAKTILSQEKSDLALLSYRATPHSSTGISPSEALMGRRLRTRMPVLPETLQPQLISAENFKRSDERAKEQYKYHYDRRHGARPLQALRPGEPVLMKTKDNEHWGNRGRISLADPNHGRYQVETPTGTVVRNRIHLQRAPHDPPHQDVNLPMPPSSPMRQQPSPEPSPQNTPTRMLHPPSTERTSRVSGRVIKRPKRFQ